MTYWYINKCDTRSVVRVRLFIVDESVLPPIADHEPKSHKDEGQQVNTCCCLWVELEKRDEEDVCADLPEERLCAEKIALLREKIQRKLEPDEEKESSGIVKEVEGTITLVTHGGRQIGRSVSFHVVMLHMMVEI